MGDSLLFGQNVYGAIDHYSQSLALECRNPDCWIKIAGSLLYILGLKIGAVNSSGKTSVDHLSVKDCLVFNVILFTLYVLFFFYYFLHFVLFLFSIYFRFSTFLPSFFSFVPNPQPITTSINVRFLLSIRSFELLG
jgi:hypothetical protein